MQAIFILGMHRSGTSTVAKAAVDLGAYPGKKLLDADEFNQKGYWENKRIVELNDKILAFFGMKWYNIDNIVLNRFQSMLYEYYDCFVHEAKAILEEEFEDSKCIVIKDPRLSLLLPFWEKVFNEIGIKTKRIIVYRKPIEVANSLYKRNGIEIEAGIKLWIYYYSILFQNVCEEFILCDFNNLLSKKQSEFKKIEEYLAIKEFNSNIAKEYLEDFLDVKMVQNDKLDTKSILSNNLNEITWQIYNILQVQNDNCKIKNFFLSRREALMRNLLSLNDAEFDDYIQLFIDTGNGYNEAESQKWTNGKNLMEIEADNIVGEPVGVRIDPSKYSVLVKINSIVVSDNKKLDTNELTGNYTHRIGEFYVFEKDDPQLVINEDISDFLKNKIKIVFEKYSLDKFTLFHVNHTVKKEMNTVLKEVKSELENTKSKKMHIEKNIIKKKQDVEEKEAVIEEKRKENELLLVDLEQNKKTISDQEKKLKSLRFQLNLIDAVENLMSTPLFDPDYYCNHAEIDRVQSKRMLIKHYVNEGAMRGLNPSEFFSTDYYLNANADIDSRIINPLHHFVQYGQHEKRAFINPKEVLKAFCQSSRKRRKLKVLKTINDLKVCYIIYRSGMYDSAYYRQKNPDFVKAMNLSRWSKYKSSRNILLKHIGKFLTHPIKHYVFHGVYEGRDVTPDFNSKYYLSHQSDVLIKGINPLYHYVSNGKSEGRKPCHLVERNAYKNENEIRVRIEGKKHFEILKESVDIIIPVYNGIEYLDNLFNSLKKHTTTPCRLIIIDDASPDVGIVDVIKKHLGDFQETIFLQNTHNLGFVKSVNKASEHVKSTCFVLLNTDVCVPNNWLERLLFPIYKEDNIATATPLSNAATVLSFPLINEDNQMNTDVAVDIDDAFKEIVYEPSETAIDIPTGIGFCMAIKTDLWKALGGFDEATFGLGYGEENDFCQRANLKGFRNVYVPNLFVFHNHGGSFEPEKKQRMLKKNLNELNRLHPGYHYQIETWIKNKRSQNFRDAALYSLFLTKHDAYLILDHGKGGGAGDYMTNTLIPEIESNGGVVGILAPKSKEVHVKGVKLEIMYKGLNLNFEYEDYYSLICNYDKNIIINELALWNDGDFYTCMDALLKTKSKIMMLIHDFYCVCPTVNLLTGQDIYCFLPDIDECNKCLTTNPHKVTRIADIKEWRNAWQQLIRKAIEVRFFSESSKRIVESIYILNHKKTTVLPHKPLIEFKECQKKRTQKLPSKELHVGVIGALGVNKGVQILLEMAKTAKQLNMNIKFFVIGYVHPDYEQEAEKMDNIFVTGAYNRADLPELLSNNSIDVTMIPSVWPETYCYVLQEIMALEYPVISFGIGAQGERVNEYSKGQIVKEIDANCMLETLRSILM